MNILLTNDDGYLADGINLLFNLLRDKHNVIMVAPNESNSAKSVAITLHREIDVKKINGHLFVTDGTPADCVAFGLSSLNVKFDLVISGCNHGLNTSYDTMYSGTVGAGLQALTYGVPSIAISCNNNFGIIEKYFLEVFDYILKNELLSKEYTLNVNFPLGDVMKEIRITHIHYRKDKEATYYVKNQNGLYRALRNVEDDVCEDEDSDVYAVRHQNVSITKIKKALD